MFLHLGVSNVAGIPAGGWRSITWESGSNIGVYGTNEGVELRFTHNADDIRQSVSVVQLPCHFGGTRPMLRCPRCYRRCRSLYLYGARFICRTCTRARYWTQTASTDARLTKCIRHLQARLAPDEDVDDYVVDWVPDRPKGMRRHTYAKLVERLEHANDRRDAYLEPGLIRLLARYMTQEQLDDLLKDPT
jgi:hypothetical protein